MNHSIIEATYNNAVMGIKESWLNGNSEDWYNYIIQLPVQLKYTYLIVVLENQVINGGFDQYFFNGYGQFAHETIKALAILGASKKADLLQDALLMVMDGEEDEQIFRRNLLSKENGKLFNTDDLYEPLNKIDGAYYLLDKEESLTEKLTQFLKYLEN